MQRNTILCLVAGLIFITPICAQNLIHVRKIGKGDPIIFLPGIGCAGEVWNGVTEHLAKNYECIVVSFPGFAGIPASNDTDFARIELEIVDLASSTKKKPLLVGHSFGGHLALKLSAQNPGVFSRLVIVDAYPFWLGQVKSDITPEQAKQQASLLKNMMLKLSSEQFKAMQEAALKVSITDEKNVQRAILWYLASDRAAIAQAQYQLLSTDLREQLSLISIPIFVIGTWKGREAQGMSEQKVQELLKTQYSRSKATTIKISDHARHFVMLDDPEWLTTQILNFLKQ